MPADMELAQYVNDAGLGTLGTDLFAGEIPAGVTTAMAFTQYPGGMPELTCGSNGMVVERPRLQLRIRHTDETAALTLAKLVAILLSKIVGQSLSGVRYRAVTVLQTPGLLYRDENNHPNYGFNLEAEKDPS